VAYENPDQIKNILICQQGALDFQRGLLDLAEKKPWLRDVLRRPAALCRLIGRVLGAPTREEAVLLGDVTYDQNFGADNQSRAIEERTVSLLREQGECAFFEHDRVRNMEWFSGMYSRCDPFHWFMEGYKRQLNYASVKRLCYARRILTECAGKRIVLVGAGANAAELLKFFDFHGQADLQIEAIADNSAEKWGMFLSGIPVKPLDGAFEANTYVVTTFLYKNELIGQIRRLKGDGVTVISY
jgi:hypothetical protein